MDDPRSFRLYLPGRGGNLCTRERPRGDREASALRTVVILATTFPKDSESQLRGLIRRYIADAATQEWAMMAMRGCGIRQQYSSKKLLMAT